MIVNCDICQEPQNRVRKYPVITCINCKTKRSKDKRSTEIKYQHIQRYGKNR